MADLIHPGHPLMQAITDLQLEAHRSKLKQGTVLVDPNDDGLEPKVLFMSDHSVRQASDDRHVSRRLQFVEIDQQGLASHAGWAPHLDLQPIDSHDQTSYMEDIVESLGLNILPLTPAIAALAESGIVAQGDTGDRLIAATAIAHNVPLITADEKLRATLGLRCIW